MNNDILVLYVFKSLYESRSAKVVSELYGISPSKVSRYIAMLRDSYLDTLFIRKRAGFIPTEKSRRIYPIVCSAIKNIEKTGLVTTNGNQIEEFVVLVPDFMAIGIVRYLERLVSKDNFILKTKSSDLMGDLAGGQVSMAISCLNYESVGIYESNPAIKIQLIGEYKNAYLIASNVNPIWDSSFSVEDIAGYPFASISHYGDCSCKEAFEVYCEHNDIYINVILRTDSMNGLVGLVSDSHAVSIVYSSSLVGAISKFNGIKVSKLSERQVKKIKSVSELPTSYLLSCNRSDDNVDRAMLELLVKDL